MDEKQRLKKIINAEYKRPLGKKTCKAKEGIKDNIAIINTGNKTCLIKLNIERFINPFVINNLTKNIIIFAIIATIYTVKDGAPAFKTRKTTTKIKI